MKKSKSSLLKPEPNFSQIYFGILNRTFTCNINHIFIVVKMNNILNYIIPTVQRGVVHVKSAVYQCNWTNSDCVRDDNSDKVVFFSIHIADLKGLLYSKPRFKIKTLSDDTHTLKTLSDDTHYLLIHKSLKYIFFSRLYCTSIIFWFETYIFSGFKLYIFVSNNFFCTVFYILQAQEKLWRFVFC